MRTASAPEQTVLSGTVSGQFLKVEIKNAAGTWIDYSSYLSIDWQDRCEIRCNVNQRIAEATVEIARATQAGSLSPLMNTEIAAGRAIRISGSRVTVGSSLSHKLLFQGVIDSVSWDDDPMVLIARDDAGKLVDRWVREERGYGTEEGRAIESVMQDLINDWADGAFTLYTPTSPGFLIVPYRQTKQSVFDALQALADLIGWVVEERWDNGMGAFRLTFYEPDRSPSGTLWSFGPDNINNVTRLNEDSANVRNRITVRYTDAATRARASYEVEDTISIAKYDLQWAEFEEASDSPIDSAAEAQTLGDAALADMAWPEAEQEIEVDLFWPVQLGDFYEFPANAAHYGADQEFGVTGYVHVFENGEAVTRIATRGKPVGHTEGWLKRETKVRPEEEILDAVKLQNWRFTYDLDAVPPTLTIEWDRGDLVDMVWIYDVLRTNPVADDPWPTVVTELLPVGTDVYVTEVPDPDERRFIKFETHDAAGFPRWVRKFEIPPPPIASPDDLGDASIAVGKLKLAVQNYSLSNPNTFTPTDYNTVAWGAVTLHTAQGNYSIASGNTGNMAAATPYYIYFNPAVSTTAFQVTPTLATATADNVILICICMPKTDTSQEAFFLPGVGILGGLGEDQISANLAAFNILAANTITAILINVGQLSAITSDLGTATAGSLQNGAGTFFLDLNATGTDQLLLVTDGVNPVLEILANGDATFYGTVAAERFIAATASFEGLVEIKNLSAITPAASLAQNKLTLANGITVSTIEAVYSGVPIVRQDTYTEFLGGLGGDVGGGSAQAFERGAADSGGSGYRLVRVPN